MTGLIVSEVILDNEQIDVGATEALGTVASNKPARVYTDEEVNNIVAAKIAKASEKTRAQLEAEYQSKQSMGGMTVDKEALYGEFKDRFYKDLQKEQEANTEAELQNQWKQVVNEYNTKLAAGKDSYSDFDQVMSDFNHPAYNNVVYGASQLSNTADVMYELANNPAKAAQLELLGKTDPKGFNVAMKKLSDSIAANKSAKDVASIKEPLSQMKPSVVGAESGKKTIADYKKMFRG